MTLCVMAIIYPGARFLVQLLSGSSEPIVLDNAVRLLHFVAPFYFVLGLLNIYRISLQAIGQKILPIISSIIELIVKILFVVIFIPRHGYFAVIVCEPIIWCLMVAELMPSFLLNPCIRKSGKEKSIHA